MMMLAKRCSAVVGLPGRLIAASFCRNDVLLYVSEANSLTFSAPYAVPSKGFTSSNSLVNCTVMGCDLFSSTESVAAWVASCINVQASRPVLVSSTRYRLPAEDVA